MLWRKLLAVAGLFLIGAGSISAQDGWRSSGSSPDGWKASAATLGIPTVSTEAAKPKVPTSSTAPMSAVPSGPAAAAVPAVLAVPTMPTVPAVSTFRGVQQTSSLDAPIRTAGYDEQMPLPTTLPPYDEVMPPPKATLIPPQPKAQMEPPVLGQLNGYNRYPGVSDVPAAPPGFDPTVIFRPRGQVWLTPEYILWRTTGMKIPPIATSSAVGTSQAQTGVLGLPSTHLLFGDDKILNDWRSGVRVNTGFWFNEDQSFGTDMTFFYLGTKQRNYSAASAGDPLLARPFFDASTGLQSSQIVTYTTRNADGTLSPVQVGTIGLRATTNFWGAEFNFRRNLWDDSTLRVDGLLGFRFLQLRDTLDIGSTVQANDPTAASGVAFGTTFASLDSFYTRSDFYGGQVGVKGDYTLGRWSIGMTGKIALGSTYQSAAINGFSITNVPGNPSQTAAGGLFAQNTNIGHYSSTNFSAVPEININISYQLTDQIRIFAGYSALYWSNVIRAGDQIDFAVNSTQIPTGGTNSLSGASRPAFIMHESSFWANGINIGMEFRW